MKTLPTVILRIDTSRAFGRGLLAGIVRYARQYGPWAFDRQAGGMATGPEYLNGREPDGIILQTSFSSSVSIKQAIPAIYVLPQPEIASDVPTITADDQAIGHMAAEYFLGRGFKNFAYYGSDEVGWGAARGKYFQQRIVGEGFSVHFYKKSESPIARRPQQERNDLARWIQSLPKPLALLACCDADGQQVLDACKPAEIKVPDDVAVLGVDNDEFVCDLSDPPLASIALNTEQAGYQAAELLDRLMKGEKVASPQIVMVRPDHVVARQSTDFLAFEDPDVAGAFRFIQHNAATPISVTDVTDAVAISRRVLEKKFQNLAHRSIYQEIRRTRVGRIMAMLMETDLSVAAIAGKMGFPGVEHIARYFQKETGMSLRDYRKKHSRRSDPSKNR